MIGRKNLSEITRTCIQGGATIIQLREPSETTTKQWLSDVNKIRKATTNSKTKFIINNRIDIALAVNADGIHLGKDDLPISQARKLIGEDKIIGITVRNIKQARQAQKLGANYISVGSIFPSPTKSGALVVGIKTLRQVVKAVKIPVITIGGINHNNIKEVVKTGVSGVVVISAVFKGIDFTKPSFKKKIIHNLKQLSKNINL